MHPYLTPLALKHFPRQPVPGVFPYQDVGEVFRKGSLPPSLWEEVCEVVDFHKLRAMLSPPMLDSLFAHIQSCVERDHFPPGMGPKSQDWFKYIYPHCRRDVYLSKHSEPDLVGQEMDLVQYRLNHPMPGRGHYPWTISKWYADRFTPEQKEKWLNKHNNLIEHHVEPYSPHYLFAPNLSCLGLGYQPLSAPKLPIWKIWIGDLQQSVQDIDGFHEIRDFCYSVERLLADPSTPAVQRDYLTSWVARMSSTPL